MISAPTVTAKVFKAPFGAAKTLLKALRQPSQIKFAPLLPPINRQDRINTWVSLKEAGGKSNLKVVGMQQTLFR